MNKKIIITISIILGLTVIVGGFWFVQRFVQDDNQQIWNNEQEKVEVVENGNDEDQKQETENIKTSPQLSPEEIEKLKKEKDLVWYEIPELGIKFLVTKDTKSDLRYTVKSRTDQFGEDSKFVILYNQSEVNFKKKNYNANCFNESGDAVCNNAMYLSKISLKYNKYLEDKFGADSDWFCNRDGKGKQKLLSLDNNYIVCSHFNPQSFNWENEIEYNKYLKTIKDKNFNFYFETTQKI